MQKYDLYINEKKPGIGLYVRTGSGLPDFADPSNWIFSGTAEQDLLPSSVVEDVETNGHAFRVIFTMVGYVSTDLRLMKSRH